MNVALDMRRRLQAAFGDLPVGSPVVAEGGHLSDLSSTPPADEPQSSMSKTAEVFVLQGSSPRAADLFCRLVLSCGQQFPVKSLLSAIPAGGLRDDTDTIIAAMANLGFYVSEHRFNADRWIRARLPVLLTDHRGLLLLVPGGDGEPCLAHVFDGKNSSEVKTDLEQLEGQACWIFRFESAQNPLSSATRTHTTYSWARALLDRFPRVPLVILMLSLALAVTGILFPLSIAVFFGEVIRLSTFQTMPQLVAGLLLLAGFEMVFVLQRAKIASWLASRLEFLVNTSSFAQILRLSPMISERASPTTQAARLRSFESIRDFCSGPTFSALLDLPIALLSLIFVGFLSLSALGILVASIILLLVVFGLTWRKAAVLTSIAADEATEMQRLAIETLDKLDVIRNAGMQDIWCQRIDRIADREQNAQMRLRFAGQVADSIAAAIYTFSIIAVMSISATEVWAGSITGPSLLALVIISLRILLPFQTMCMSVLRFEQIRRSLVQINALMDLPTERQAEREKNRLQPLTGRVSLVNVGFKAADTRPVFVGLDLEVEPGEVVGIYGANGTGKSTIFKMILGMVDTSLGAVRIDGVDIRQLPLHELRRRVSYVPQQPKLFPGTLRQNLLTANPLASDQHLRRVLETVGLLSTIQGFPNGLDERVTINDEERYSESFRYRFAFARALLINSKIFLIDEISNALLDAEVGQLLMRLLKDFKGKRTVIFISHRSDFLQQADRVVALRYGKVPLVNKPQSIMERAS
ncbi:peptidase domain-containing ABC transporter [Peteryoungia ipomoeae]|uniref:ATP-binding cassette domain-containing protein n=1 Tax=Peteryoungia ipomoeae TaxID=1210932 RepID=A0A4S8NV00_9HYPH|nr:ATP-binding cassette domain-containing protein [Peteryoungia ipomoeae]THV20581.1 ATP-binding cassette domain-containing protein [Peteryoungia ipomoeae]